MTHYRFKQAIKVNGVPYVGGQIVPKSEINGGCAAAMLSIQQIEECDPPAEPVPEAPKPEKVEAPKVEVKPVAKPEKK